MAFIKKLKAFAVLLFVCTFLISSSLTSCNQKSEATDEHSDHPAGEEEHPAGEEEEHPTNESDTTKVEGDQ